MVSNASDDFPEPERPVITVRRLRGIATEMFLRLCSRAPRTTRNSWAIAPKAIRRRTVGSMEAHRQIARPRTPDARVNRAVRGLTTGGWGPNDCRRASGVWRLATHS